MSKRQILVESGKHGAVQLAEYIDLTPEKESRFASVGQLASDTKTNWSNLQMAAADGIKFTARSDKWRAASDGYGFARYAAVAGLLVVVVDEGDDDEHARADDDCLDDIQGFIELERKVRSSWTGTGYRNG